MKFSNNNKSPNSKREELKDNTKKKTCKNTVVEYKINGREERKKGKIMTTQPKSIGKYSH